MKYNRILENKAREELKDVIENMRLILPEMMARKVPEADVQQAFVVKAVMELIPRDAAVLCVGAQEDTAAEYLDFKEGYTVNKTDPAWGDPPFETLNPEPKYGCVFATSVLEHVAEPHAFVAAMCKALKPGGVGILTCDFAEDWPAGLEYPPTDRFMFTGLDMVRLAGGAMEKGCLLVGDPDWAHAPKDFTYLGRFHYDFATMVFKKG